MSNVFLTVVNGSPAGIISGEKWAYFNQFYSDHGIDIDEDGSYESIIIDVGINVFSPSIYTVRGLLCNSNGSEIINVTKQAYLRLGASYMSLDFYGLRATGPHHLNNLTLYDSSGNVLDQIGDAYLTKAYNRIKYFLPAKAKLTGNYTDCGLDINGDDSYDFLAVEVGVNVETPGEYNLCGYLYDSNDREVAWSIDHEYLSSGYRTMHLNFDGKSINKHGVNGPYYLKELTLSAGSSETYWTTEDAVPKTHTTSAYNFSDFYGQIM
jgi:hypothetical protein